MLSYSASLETAQLIQKICKRKNILILNTQESETDISQYVKETKINSKAKIRQRFSPKRKRTFHPCILIFVRIYGKMIRKNMHILTEALCSNRS